jgi:tyrosyl-tRNA synthetase
VGDPSGKSQERNLLSEQALNHNVSCIAAQLAKFLDFGSAANAAVMVNNYDWFKDFSLLGFLRDVGKHISVNYMMAKDSVKKRLETGISFTEFSYQLIQGYDFYWLWKNKGVKLQMGGSDQWGNIVTGTELIRRMAGGEAYALTVPLVTKADGSKFGKTEQGNVWLDAAMTSPYQFYQFWLNASDDDAARYIKMFTFLSQEIVEVLISEHAVNPAQRLLQKKLAEEVTCMVHGRDEYETALNATAVLFGQGTKEQLSTMPIQTFLQVFEGVPQFDVQMNLLEAGIPVLDLLAVHSSVFESKGDARKMMQQNAVSFNKEKYADANGVIGADWLIGGKYLLVQKGKKNYYLLHFTA